MREILFRGKRKDNGEWVEGFYYLKKIKISGDKTFMSEEHMITTGVELIGGAYGESLDYIEYKVIPETVGQYTGLTDKNDNKICEGDIVLVNVKGYNTVCTVSWADVVAHFQLWQVNTIPKTSTNLNLGNYDCEIIGNIHDNPELLKEGAE